jgi:hypothetical protein
VRIVASRPSKSSSLLRLSPGVAVRWSTSSFAVCRVEEALLEQAVVLDVLQQVAPAALWRFCGECEGVWGCGVLMG